MSLKSLINQFRERQVIKIYRAFSWSVPLPIAGTIEKPISNYLNKKKTSTEGKHAITNYKVIKSFKNYFSDNN